MCKMHDERGKICICEASISEKEPIPKDILDKYGWFRFQNSSLYVSIPKWPVAKGRCRKRAKHFVLGVYLCNEHYENAKVALDINVRKQEGHKGGIPKKDSDDD